MIFIKNIFTVLLIIVLFFSCKKETKKEVKIETKEVAINLKKSEFHIKGMTCEIGCAKLIQSKLAKVAGVKSIKVSFKDSLGMIEYDSNKLSSKNIAKFVDKIAGGDLYKITDLKDVTSFSVK